MIYNIRIHYMYLVIQRKITRKFSTNAIGMNLSKSAYKRENEYVNCFARRRQTHEL